MTAWLQNVYDAAKSSAAPTAAPRDPDKLGGDEDEQAAGERRGRRRREVQRVRRLGARQPRGTSCPIAK